MPCCLRVGVRIALLWLGEHPSAVLVADRYSAEGEGGSR
jgi:hypothetical protein